MFVGFFWVSEDTFRDLRDARILKGPLKESLKGLAQTLREWECISTCVMRLRVWVRRMIAETLQHCIIRDRLRCCF